MFSLYLDPHQVVFYDMQSFVIPSLMHKESDLEVGQKSIVQARFINGNKYEKSILTVCSMQPMPLTQPFFNLFLILLHDPVIKKLSSILSIIRVNLFMGTENVRNWLGTKGLAETSNIPRTLRGWSTFLSR